MSKQNISVLKTAGENVDDLITEIRDIILDANEEELKELLSQSKYINYYESLLRTPVCERLHSFKKLLAGFETNYYIDKFEELRQNGLPKNLVDKKEEDFFNRFLLLCASLSDKVDEHILTM